MRLLHKGSEKTMSLILGELPKVKQARADAVVSLMGLQALMCRSSD